MTSRHFAKIFSWVFALIATTIFFSAQPVAATIYYVSTTGSDSNPGTSSQPLRTITKGVKVLSAGDTLYVASGTYTDNIDTWNVPIANGISWSTPITVAAQPGHTVTIKPNNGNPFLWIAHGQNKYLIIKGFIIDGKNTNTHGLKFEGSTKYVRVIDCEVKNSRLSGILVTGNSASYHEFINVNVHHNGISNLDHGVYLTSGNNLIEKSQIHHNKGYGIHIYNGSTTAANNNTIRNNSAYDNTTSGQWGCGILMSSGNGNQAYNNVAFGNFAGICSQNNVTNSRIFNNITYENDVYGIYVGYSTTSGSRVENNTVYNNGTYGIFAGDGATTTTVKNNIVYANNNNFGLTNTTSSNNFDTNPLFVNAAGKDFHLQASSPVIDKGTTISGISTDFEGKPRPKGAQFDIGAHEYQGTSSSGGSSSGGTTSGGTTSGGTTSGGTTSGGTTSPGTTTTTTAFPPPLASPSPGSTLTSSTVTFSGAHTSKDLEHMLRVGTTNGGSQIYYQSMGTNHSVTISGLPASGKIYVMYWTRINTGWFQQTHTYTMNVGGSSSSSGGTSSGGTTSTSSGGTTSGGTAPTTTSIPPPLVSPSPGSTLTSSTVTFSGAHTSKDLEHMLRVGTTNGGSQIYYQSMGTNHSVTISGLPASGKIYVMYWTRINTGWFQQTHTYTMNVGGSSSSSGGTTSTSSGGTTSGGTAPTTTSIPPPLVSPSPGSTLTSSTVTFSGAHTSKDLEHMLRVGTTNGGSQIYYQSMGTNHSVTVSGLPASGKIYVMYWTRINTGWFQQTHTYTMSR